MQKNSKFISISEVFLILKIDEVLLDVKQKAGKVLSWAGRVWTQFSPQAS